MVKKLPITSDFEKKLESVIHEIESQSQIEIVPVMVKRASNYTAWSIVYGLVFAYLMESLLRYYLYGVLLGQYAWLEIPLFFVAAIVLAWILRQTPLFPHFVPKKLRHDRATTMAQALFSTERICETKHRLGILICVFEFERSVLVFADRGFDGKVDGDFWANLGETLAHDFNRRRPGDEFFAALADIKKNLLPAFKDSSADNPNELSDRLRKK